MLMLLILRWDMLCRIRRVHSSSYPSISLLRCELYLHAIVHEAKRIHHDMEKDEYNYETTSQSYFPMLITFFDFLHISSSKQWTVPSLIIQRSIFCCIVRIGGTSFAIGCAINFPNVGILDRLGSLPGISLIPSLWNSITIYHSLINQPRLSKQPR